MKRYLTSLHKLMTIFGILTITTLIPGIGWAKNTSNTLDYQIKYINNSSSPYLNFLVTFYGSESDSTLVHVPNSGIKNISATSDGVPTQIIKDPTNPNNDTFYILHDKKGALIAISYNLIQTSENPPTVSSFSSIIINPAYFYFFGNEALVFPINLYNQDIALTMVWNFPDYYKIFNSFGILKTQQNINLKNIDNLDNSLFLGGDFRLVDTTTHQPTGQIVYTVMRGEWPFTDKEYAATLNNKVFTSINSFWPIDQPKILLNAIMPVNSLAQMKHNFITNQENKFQLAGSSWYNAFILMSTVPKSGTNDMWESITSLSSHEYNHNWLPGKLAILPDDDLGGRWFGEGINEYLAQKLRLQTHNMLFTEYIKRSNNVVMSYFTSPAFGEKIDKGTYPKVNNETKYSVQHSYYRGELLAWQWKLTNSGNKPIDIILLQMLKDANESVPLYTDKLVANYVATLGVKHPLNDIKRYARNGDAIKLTGDELGPCVKSKNMPMLRYTIGFDLQKSKDNKKIIGLIKDGTAMHAGLHEGDKFTQLKYDYGNTASMVEIKLINKPTPIIYSPALPIEVIQYYIDVPESAIPAKCYTWFDSNS